MSETTRSGLSGYIAGRYSACGPQRFIVIPTVLIVFLLIVPVQAIAVSTLQHTFPAGWSLVSIPIDPTGNTPEEVFTDVPLPLRINAYNNGRTLTPGEAGFPSLLPGTAIWMLLEESVTVRVTGELAKPDAAYTLSISPGWNLIGSPWAVPVEWADSDVMISEATGPLPLSEAIARDWLSGELRQFETGVGAYGTLTANNATPELLRPWIGYALYSNISGEIHFSPPQFDSSPPLIAIRSPAEGVEVTDIASIIGTASDVDLVQYILEYAETGSGVFTPFAAGSSSVVDATLGVFNSTLLLNGIYTIRLSATDAAGNTSVGTTNLLVGGGQKVGNFQVSFVDLHVPVVGLPIRVERRYDSRNKGKGDFGAGWTMEVGNVRVQENRPLATGWEGTVTGQFVKTYCIQQTRPHIVSVTFPDDKVHEFEPYQNCLVTQVPQGEPLLFRPLPGTQGKLEIMTDASVAFLDPFPGPVTLYNLDIEVFEADQYRFTSVEGDIYEIDQHNGLMKRIDANGNTLTFSDAGIIHSSGKSISFERDSLDRITRITDPMGNFIQYAYDVRGDLTAVTDPSGLTTTFTYNKTHGLVGIQDPLGRQPVRNDYDSDGRLVSVTDASGNKVEFTRIPGVREEVVRDRSGNVTVHAYDERGNIIQTIDPLGNITTRTFDSRDNMLTETDAMGNVKSFAYSASDQIVSLTDALGHATAFTRNSRTQILTRTDPLGRVTTYTYNDQGSVLTEVDPLGYTFTHAYDNRGNRITKTDPGGHVTTYEHDGDGNIIKETRPPGIVIERTYDDNNNMLTESTARILAGTTQVAVRQYEYDKSNRILHYRDAEGGITVFTYTSSGHRETRTDPLGRMTTAVYDAQSRMVATIHPDGATESFEYDASDNKIASTDAAGRTTRYEYDKLGRLTRTIYPDGSSTAATYDAMGNKTSETDENGHTILLAYDAMGRNVSIVNPLGATETFVYDAVGNMVEKRDRNGNTLLHVYDANDRLVRTWLPDGTHTDLVYDPLGRALAEIDQASRITRSAFDAAGRVIAVTDALGNVSRYDYDALGNRISETDALGNITRYVHDTSGRIVQKILPLGQVETRAYDAAGNVVAVTDFNGQAAAFEYDLMGRPVRKRLHDGSEFLYTYTPTGNLKTLSDARGVTAYEYDLRDRPVRVLNPDGTEIVYTYDAKGNRASITAATGTTRYEYDAADRLIAVIDPDNNRTEYGYDAQGNRTSLTYPNGISTEYAYDALNRLTQVTHRKDGGVIRSFAYTLGPAGNRTKVVEESGRTVDYGYDALYRLTSETITDSVNGNAAVSYTYDAGGNRLTQETLTDVITYQYDENNRMTSALHAAKKAGASLSGSPAVGSAGHWIDLHQARLIVLLMLAGYLLIAFRCFYGVSGGTDGRWRAGLLRPVAVRAMCLILIPMNLLASDIILAVHAEAAAAEAIEASQTDTTYGYDHNGNLVSRTQSGKTEQYEYDGNGRMVRHTSLDGETTEYEYDGMNQRVSQSRAGAVTNYLVDAFTSDGLAKVIREYDDSGVTLKEYVYGSDLVSIRGNGTNYYVYDGGMSARNLTDDAGVVTDTYHYDAFGNLLSKTGSTGNDFLYNGQQLDPNLGFYYLRARYYDAGAGRFISRDPRMGSPFDPASLHAYTYAHSNPVNRSDPTGEFSLGEAGIAAAISGVLVGLAVFAYTGSIKKAAIAGVITAVAVFALLAIFVVAPAGAAAGAGGAGAGGAGAGGAASGTGTATAVTVDGAEVAFWVKEFGTWIATGRIQQVTATFTAMLSTPQGRALIRGVHKVACNLLVISGAAMPPDVFRTFQNLCDLSGPFVTGPP